MNRYRVTNIYEIGGNSESGERAQTPYDASEKSTKLMGWREKERLVRQEVMILDGSKRIWEFKK